MSFPQNPLHKFSNTTIRHILIAFKYTEDAEKVLISPSLGNPGDVFVGKDCKGPAVVVINEFTRSDFSIFSAEWTWNFYGPITQTSSSCIGHIEITDRTGLHFVDFMKNKVSQILDISEGHIVFALKTFFIGKAINSEENDLISGNPLIFNMISFVNNLSSGSGRFYNMGFVGSATTFGHLNQYSRLYQMTITHSDGNIHKEIPNGNVSTSGIKTRKDEDKLQLNARKNRIDKSKPMKTLKECFAAFEVELNQQKFTHSAQLQKWLQQVNNGYVSKIVPPIQRKIGGIPVDFKIKLDPQYNDYEIDNRNLPFEQPEQDQSKSGVRVLPIKNGEDIVKVVENIMKLSRKIGQDSELENSFIFKTSISTIKSITDRYLITIIINKINVPKNKENSNTGPGNGAINPLQFVFQDPNFLDKDIIDLDGKVCADMSVKVLEKDIKDSNNLIVYGDREQITSERLPEVDYFKTQYSGMRSLVNPMYNYGLESGVDACKIDNNINVELKQSTSYKLKIRGNPFLLFDLNRLPTNVANNKIGDAMYYKLPELEPMYVKLTIYLSPHAAIGLEENENVSTKFYFDNFLHVASITNKFESGSFVQDLLLLRSDQSV